jgi:hypothetical protein
MAQQSAEELLRANIEAFNINDLETCGAVEASTETPVTAH